MRKISRGFTIILALTAMFLSACGAASITNSTDPVSGGKGNASPVNFTGMVEAINGDQWTINGQVVTVNPAIIKDGPFKVGDQIKVEANVQADGSVVITRVENPLAPVAASTDVPVVPSPTDDSISTPQVISTPDPAVSNSYNEAFGAVDSFDGTTIAIDGQSYTIANGAEIKDTITAGSFVKVEFIFNADGTASIQQIQLWDPAAVADNSNSGSGIGSGSHDQNDDNGNDGVSHDQNDDHGNDDSSHDQNDDHGGNDG